jgi:hypothetical protein
MSLTSPRIAELLDSLLVESEEASGPVSTPRRASHSNERQMVALVGAWSARRAYFQ